MPHLSSITAIAPNLNRRLSGVTSTIVRLVPLQAHKGVASFGVGLPDFVPRLYLWQLLRLGFVKTQDGKPRVWHARRNVEMLLGLFLRHVMRQNLKLLFTSASQRHHSRYTKFLINRMDHVIATSKATAKYLKVPNTVILHGINLDQFEPAKDIKALRNANGIPGEFVIGCVGRIRKQKGTDVFVDAMIKLLPDYPKASAIVLGRATASHQSFLEGLKEKVAKAGLSDRILFPDEVPVHKIAIWYQMMTLFIAPQRWEGFGLTPLEAMGCGVPVIATTVGAFPELIVEGETGTLIEPGNVTAMIEAARRYLNDPHRVKNQSETAHSHVHESFPIEREAEAILTVYDRLRNQL